MIGELKREMGTLWNSTCCLCSPWLVTTFPLQKNPFLVPSLTKKNANSSVPISCKLPESEVEENYTSSSVSSNKMEEYNLAMKRMMRNPYEYHHDLGISLIQNQICLFTSITTMFLLYYVAVSVISSYIV